MSHTFEKVAARSVDEVELTAKTSDGDTAVAVFYNQLENSTLENTVELADGVVNTE
jgi:hypothetical protein